MIYILRTLLCVISLALFSCVSSKINSLKSENTKLRFANDSLTKELAAKSLALTQAQKTISQLSTEKSKKIVVSRKKLNADHQDDVPMFMHNITKYVEWQPAKLENYFVIGVVGNETMFEKISSQFKGKTIADKPVIIKRMNSAKEIEPANLFYISSSKIYLLPEVEKNTVKGGTLIMSDMPYDSEGIHINFFNENDTLHFDMNEEEIKKSRLVISSSLKNLQK